MKQIKLPGRISAQGMANPCFIPASRRNYENALNLYAGKDVVVTIAKPTKTRSNPQNAYLWGIPYKLIAKETGDDTESIHHYLTGMFLSEKTTSPIPQS